MAGTQASDDVAKGISEGKSNRQSVVVLQKTAEQESGQRDAQSHPEVDAISTDSIRGREAVGPRTDDKHKQGANNISDSRTVSQLETGLS